LVAQRRPVFRRQVVLPRHGGARRKPGEPSHRLSIDQCRQVVEAAYAALDVGRPLNRWITIAWGLGGLYGYSGTRATGEFLKIYRDWMRSRGARICWVYSHETGDYLGIHVHLLLHVPRRLDGQFGNLPLRWVKRLLPNRYVAGVVNTQKLYGGEAGDAYFEAAYIRQLNYKLHYMLKAGSKRTEAALKLQNWGHKEWGQDSRVEGKRCGCWQNWRRLI